MTVMKSHTVHTVKIGVQLGPSEPRELFDAVCVVKLMGVRSKLPKFLSFFHPATTIGKAHIIIEHKKKELPIKVLLPRVKRPTEFDVLVHLLGRVFIATDRIVVV